MEGNGSKPLSIFLDIFRRADKNDDGALHWEEFKAFFADGVLSEEELKNLFNEIDTHNTNNIDTEELCTYFSQHLGHFEAVFKAAESLSSAMNAALHATAQDYPSGSQFDKFTTRFLLRECVNHVAAIQSPLEVASDTLDAQAKEEIEAGDSQDLKPATATGSDPVSPADAVIPGRIGRRVRRNYSSQSSYGGDGANGSLNKQVERLRLLIDRLENKVNFDGIAEEEIDANDDDLVLIVHRKLIVNEASSKNFRSSMRSYLEATGKSAGCLHTSVRAYVNSTIFSIYEIWANEDDWKSYVRGDSSKRFQRSNIDHLEIPEQLKTLAVPHNWWSKE